MVRLSWRCLMTRYGSRLQVSQNHGPNIGVICPVPTEFVVHLDGSQNVPIGAANALLFYGLFFIA
jgi:hypothetical protein